MLVFEAVACCSPLSRYTSPCSAQDADTHKLNVISPLSHTQLALLIYYRKALYLMKLTQTGASLTWADWWSATQPLERDSPEGTSCQRERPPLTQRVRGK